MEIHQICKIQLDMWDCRELCLFTECFFPFVVKGNDKNEFCVFLINKEVTSNQETWSPSEENNQTCFNHYLFVLVQKIFDLFPSEPGSLQNRKQAETEVVQAETGRLKLPKWF